MAAALRSKLHYSSAVKAPHQYHSITVDGTTSVPWHSTIARDDGSRQAHGQIQWQPSPSTISKLPPEIVVEDPVVEGIEVKDSVNYDSSNQDKS
ncbi:hypothetical protein RHGRI_007830 [Rhododendron griersonianum]|uniref:Late embryogenesis abundant protein n=1 Tax=Rhododendron griersonianum TaxID=479676 RepID=A0AAV6KY68_9ERIC|nr:hypothetical protein RHGRI_007830 [Rhododendron griersonianum]